MSSIGSLVSLLSSPESDRIYGVTVGIVSNINDSKKLGRVKVKFPMFSDDFESDWIRAVAPMVGVQQGVYFPLAVNDEVLVAFEQGNVQLPYILGALWNGKYKPPEPNPEKSQIISRSGHTITLDDTKDQECIEIKDASGKVTITLSSKDKSLTIESDGDITLKSTNGKLVFSGKKGVDIEASGENVTVNAKQLEVK